MMNNDYDPLNYIEPRAFVKNGDDEEQVKKGKQKEKDTREQELEDVRQLLQLPAGRRFFWRYLSFCQIYESIFSNEPVVMAMREGRRQAGLSIMADIADADPDAIIKMMLEAKANNSKL